MECRHCLGHKATARSQFRVLFAVEMAGSYCFVGLPASGLVWCHVSIMDVEKEEREKERKKEEACLCYEVFIGVPGMVRDELQISGTDAWRSRI